MPVRYFIVNAEVTPHLFCICFDRSAGEVVEVAALPSLPVRHIPSKVFTRHTEAGVGQKKVVQALSMYVPPTQPITQPLTCT